MGAGQSRAVDPNARQCSAIGAESLLVEHVITGDEKGVQASLTDLGQVQKDRLAAKVVSSEYGERGAHGALHSAAQYGRAEILRHLLDLGVDPNSLDDACNTPLHLASEGGHARAAYVLLKAGALASISNSFGRTAAERAEDAAWDRPQKQAGKACIRRMIAGHFEPYGDLPPEPEPLTAGSAGGAAHAPSGAAAREPSALARGAALAVPAFALSALTSAPAVPSSDECGPNLLSGIARTGDAGAVRATLEKLRAKGGEAAVREEVCNCEAGDHDVRVALSSLHVAARTGDSEVLRVLLSTRACPSATNDQMNTPLHFAADSGKSKVADILLQAGADPLISNSFGRTAQDLTIVSEFDTEEVAEGKAAIRRMLGDHQHANRLPQRAGSKGMSHCAVSQPCESHVGDDIPAMDISTTGTSVGG